MRSSDESRPDAYPLTFHPDTSEEVSAAYHWYEEQAKGLGDDWITELEIAYQAIIQMPETWPPFQKGFRRFLLTRFPFSVIYRVHRQRIYVVAVMHNSRRPGYWLERLR